MVGWLAGWVFCFCFVFGCWRAAQVIVPDILPLPSPTIPKVDVFGHQTRVLIDDSWRVCDIVQEIGHKLDIGNDYEYSLKVWPAIVVVAVVVVAVVVVAVVVVVVTHWRRMWRSRLP